MDDGIDIEAGYVDGVEDDDGKEGDKVGLGDDDDSRLGDGCRFVGLFCISH